MDDIVVFADKNSILRTELFDEAQKVTTVGAVPVGILGEDSQAVVKFSSPLPSFLLLAKSPRRRLPRAPIDLVE